jgi:O-antigen/teichoic acid export membrane protein
LKITLETLKKVFHYSFANYVANLLSIVPTLILPIIVINHLGAAAAGYYYLAFMVINLLYSVSGSVSQSLFAEGSYAEDLLHALTRRSVTILLSIMIPAAFILAVFGPLVLEVFGKSYSAGGAGVIIILAITAPAVAAFNLGSVLLRIRHQMYSLVFINIVYALVICGLALHWIDRGLVWVAIAWAVGNVVAAVLAFLSIFFFSSKQSN